MTLTLRMNLCWRVLGIIFMGLGWVLSGLTIILLQGNNQSILLPKFLILGLPFKFDWLRSPSYPASSFPLTSGREFEQHAQ